MHRYGIFEGTVKLFCEARSFYEVTYNDGDSEELSHDGVCVVCVWCVYVWCVCGVYVVCVSFFFWRLSVSAVCAGVCFCVACVCSRVYLSMVCVCEWYLCLMCVCGVRV